MTLIDAPALKDAVHDRGPACVGKELGWCQDLVRRADVPHGVGVLRIATLYGWQIEHGPLPDQLKRQMQIELGNLPGGDDFCHLDLHPFNILFDGKRSTIIDWMNARLGPAAADVARTRVILDACPYYLGADRDKAEAAAHVREAYEHTTKSDAALAWEESEAWMRVTKAARLQERIAPAERTSLLQGFGLAARG